MCRLNESEALEHPRRSLIYELIKAEPGLNFRALARRAGIAPGTVQFHLRVLCYSRLIWCTYHGSRHRFFPGTEPINEEGIQKALALHALDGLDRRVLDLVRDNPRNQKAVLDEFPQLPRSTVQHRLSRMVRQGFLVVRPRGRHIVYHAGVAA